MLSNHTTLIQSFPRFWSKVALANPNDCWNWTAGLFDGYGEFRLNATMVRAHRLAYEILIGPIPNALTIDHLCRNRKCVNPFHLEPVTHKENILRGESFTAINAAKTHPYSEENTYIQLPHKSHRNGGRVCRICSRNHKRKYYRQKQEAKERKEL